MKKLNINYKIPGWKSYEALAEMAKIVQMLPDNSKIVEVGAGLGQMTWILAKNSPPGSTIYAIDKWPGTQFNKKNNPYCINCTPDMFNTEKLFKYNTNDCDNIISIKSLSPLSNWSEMVDMVIIDVDHDEIMQQQNIEYWYQFINPNGIMCGDDYCPPSGACPNVENDHEERFPEIRRAVERMAIKYNKKIINPGNSWLWFYF